jgi:hypothetical protein
VTQLEKQLPGKAEMDALLSDINQAGIGRGLQFELFRPGQVEVKDYYAELPIALRVTGRFHDIGAFAADVANLSRIVTLHNLAITPGKENCRHAVDGGHGPHLPLPRRGRVGRGAQGPRGRGQGQGTKQMKPVCPPAVTARPARQCAALLLLLGLAACGAEGPRNCRTGWTSNAARCAPAWRRWRRPRSSTRAVCQRAAGRSVQQPEAQRGAQAGGAAAQFRCWPPR